jgi:hypothetical protein
MVPSPPPHDYPALPPAADSPGVKSRLTPARRKRLVENDEYAAFARRVLRAYARRVARGDIDAVAGMVAIGRELDGFIAEAVTGLRARGYSWGDIARRLGMTRQAAHQRWGRLSASRPDPEADA